MIRRNIASLSLLGAFCMTLLSALPVHAAGPKEMLKLVPEDAWGFVFLPSLEVVDQKASQLNDLLKLQLPAPVSPMVLGPPFNWGDSVDMKSPICIVVTDVQKAGMEAFALIIPAKDPKAFLERVNAQEPQEGVCKCMVMGMPSFAAVKDKFVILGQNQNVVSRVSKAKKSIGDGFGDTRLSALAKSDIFISISVRTALAAYKDMIMGMLPMIQGAAGPAGADLKQTVEMFMQMSALDFGFTFNNKEGFSVRMLLTPKEDSDLEKLMKDGKESSDSLLSILPGEKYLFAAGWTGGYSEYSEKFGGRDPITQAAKNTEGINEKAAKAIDEEVRKLKKAATRLAVSASALPAGKSGMLGLTFVAETQDSGEFLKSLRKIYETYWSISDDEDFETYKDALAHAKDAETIGGYKVDTITVVKMEPFAELFGFELGENADSLRAVLGKDFMVRFGAVGDKHFVLSFGGGKERYEKICKSITSSGGSLSEDKGIGKMAGRLPSPRSFEAYVAVDNILQMFKTLAKLVEDEDIPVEIPKIDAPMAFSAAQLGSVMQAEMIVPVKLITGVKVFIDELEKAEMRAFDEEEDEEDEEDDIEMAEDEEEE